MAFTLGQLEAIDEAITSGSMSVSYNGKSVTYRSLDDMLRIRGIISRQLGLTTGRSNTLLAGHSKGIDEPDGVS
jgi:hypothetical protein